MGHIYFIGNYDKSAIKCGWSSNITCRIKTFETANAKDLYLIYYVEGTMDVEKSIQKYLKDYKVKNEWFEYEATMRYINQYKLNVEAQISEGLI